MEKCLELLFSENVEIQENTYFISVGGQSSQGIFETLSLSTFESKHIA